MLQASIKITSAVKVYNNNSYINKTKQHARIYVHYTSKSCIQMVCK